MSPSLDDDRDRLARVLTSLEGVFGTLGEINRFMASSEVRLKSLDQAMIELRQARYDQRIEEAKRTADYAQQRAEKIDKDINALNGWITKLLLGVIGALGTSLAGILWQLIQKATS